MFIIRVIHVHMASCQMWVEGFCLQGCVCKPCISHILSTCSGPPYHLIWSFSYLNTCT